jgi:hypothetical protein
MQMFSGLLGTSGYAAGHACTLRPGKSTTARDFSAMNSGIRSTLRALAASRRPRIGRPRYPVGRSGNTRSSLVQSPPRSPRTTPGSWRIQAGSLARAPAQTAAGSGHQVLAGPRTTRCIDFDPKLRGCDVVKTKTDDIVSGGRFRSRAIVVQQESDAEHLRLQSLLPAAVFGRSMRPWMRLGISTTPSSATRQAWRVRGRFLATRVPPDAAVAPRDAKILSRF